MGVRYGLTDDALAADEFGSLQAIIHLGRQKSFCRTAKIIRPAAKERRGRGPLY